MAIPTPENLEPDNIIRRIAALGASKQAYVRLESVYVEPQLLKEVVHELDHLLLISAAQLDDSRPNALDKLAYIVLRETVNL